jgi:hypothetical protein
VNDDIGKVTEVAKDGEKCELCERAGTARGATMRYRIRWPDESLARDTPLCDDCARLAEDEHARRERHGEPLRIPPPTAH